MSASTQQVSLSVSGIDQHIYRPIRTSSGTIISSTCSNKVFNNDQCQIQIEVPGGFLGDIQVSVKYKEGGLSKIKTSRVFVRSSSSPVSMLGFDGVLDLGNLYSTKVKKRVQFKNVSAQNISVGELMVPKGIVSYANMCSNQQLSPNEVCSVILSVDPSILFDGIAAGQIVLMDSSQLELLSIPYTFDVVAEKNANVTTQISKEKIEGSIRDACLATTNDYSCVYNNILETGSLVADQYDCDGSSCVFSMKYALEDSPIVIDISLVAAENFYLTPSVCSETEAIANGVDISNGVVGGEFFGSDYSNCLLTFCLSGVLSNDGKLCSQPQLAEGVIFEDDFEPAASLDWSNPAWAVVGGAYQRSASSTQFSYVNNLQVSDFEIEVDLQSINDVGIMLRTSDNNGLLSGMVLILAGGGGQMYWHELNNGDWGGILGLESGLNLAGASANIRIVAEGDTYSVYLNDSQDPVSVIVNNAFSSGSVGLYSNFQETTLFDNVVVRSLSSQNLEGVARMKNVQEGGIYSTRNASAALMPDGSVVAWGNGDFDGDISRAKIGFIEGRNLPLVGVEAPDCGYGIDQSFLLSAQNGEPPVVKIVANEYAFAALRQDGSIITWGSNLNGGCPTTGSGEVQYQDPGTGKTVGLNDSGFPFVDIVASTDKSFLALRQDGKYLGWGNASSFAEAGYFSNLNFFEKYPSSGVKKIFGINDFGYAFLTNDDTLYVSDDLLSSGIQSSPSVINDPLTGMDGLLNYKDFRALNNQATGVKLRAFLQQDGKLMTYGHSIATEIMNYDYSSMLSGFYSLQSTRTAIAALKNDGTVVAWGQTNDGTATSSSVIKESYPNLITTDGVNILSNVKKLYAGESTFVALRNDGSIFAWGNVAACGGGIECPISFPSLENSIKDLFPSKSGWVDAFAYIKEDNSVSSFGGNLALGYPVGANGCLVNSGGTCVEDKSSSLVNVSKVVTSTYGFSALKTDGSVVVWGLADNIQNTDTSLFGPISDISSTHFSAFTGVLSDGSGAVSWGYTGSNPLSGKNTSGLNVSNSEVVDYCLAGYELSLDGLFCNAL